MPVPIRLTHLLLMALLLVTTPLTTRGDDPQAPPQKADDEAGFTPLFQGETFEGWHGTLANYEWKQGVLTCVAKKSGNIYTDADHADFILRFDFRLTPGANNGIGLRVPDNGHASYEGMEIQLLDDDAPQYAKLQPYQAHGSVYGVAAATKGHLKPTGEWNSQEIHCIGRQVKVILNGTTIVDTNLDEASQNGTVDEKEHPGLTRTTGKICLCTHGSVIDFHNLRIKSVSPAP